MDQDSVCFERLDPDPVCPERLDPDPVNIRPDPKPCEATEFLAHIMNGHTDGRIIDKTILNVVNKCVRIKFIFIKKLKRPNFCRRSSTR